MALIVKKSVEISASVSDVWDAITDPQIVKKYFFGFVPVTDWSVGDPIKFEMTSKGETTVAVMGVIKSIDKNVCLEYTCFDPKFEDDESKHTIVHYKLKDNGDSTTVTVTQGDFGDDEDRYDESAKGWDQVLKGMKELLESE